MNPSSDQSERIEFQRLLDDRFPIGGLCVTLREREGRLQPTGVQVVTGRLVCTCAKQAKGGGWLHQVVADPRVEPDEQTSPLVVWIADLRPHETIPALWVAPIQSDGGSEWLRINADPQRPWRPTRQMRKAVTESHSKASPSSVVS